ncbi:putative protein for very long chain fatty acid elongation [Halotydeus destructor]|nr:putative protein for very long chain fatty acid elongation [Halotydeus destructor]
MDLVYRVKATIDQAVDNVSDPLSNDCLPGAPWRIMALVAAYLVMTTNVGPRLMRHRKPVQVDQLMRAYNLVNIAWNVLMLTLAMIYTNYGTLCWKNVHYSDLQMPNWTLNLAIYGFLALKVFDLLDTVFFVLRKKDSQVTTLHLVHHSIMPLTVYFGTKMAPMSPTLLIGLLNSFVHILMYTYYLLASFGPKMAPYLWWKKYLTQIQLVQFCILAQNSINFLFIDSDSGYSKTISALQLAEATYFLYSFGVFYVKSYAKKPISQDGNNNRLKTKSN